MQNRDDLIVSGIAFLLASTIMIAGSMWTSRIESRIDDHVEQLNEKLVELDGRRNGQYGVIKREIEDLNEKGGR